MKTVALIHGWSEGPWQSRKFRYELQKCGYKMSKPEEAEVIIAHSLGCYLVPPANMASQIILIGIPHWPDKSLLKAVMHNLHGGLKNHARGTTMIWWLKKLMHNWWYVLRYPKMTSHIGSSIKLDKLPDAKDRRVVVVRNHEDTFSHPDIQLMLPQSNRYEFVDIPGDHEDCWLHPERYIPLIDSR